MDKVSNNHDNNPATEKPLGSFFVMWGGQAFSLVGSRLVQFALVWYLTEQTGSATVLAFATMMAMLPEIFISPLAGALIDRWNRRLVMMVADSGIAIATIVLAVLFALNIPHTWLVVAIYLLMFVRSAGGAFHWPAMQASTTLMVPDHHLSRVAGLNQMLYGISTIVAPPLGALLLSVLPMQSILAIDVVTALLAVAPLFFISVPQPEREASADDASPTTVLRDLKEGLQFVWSWPGLFIIIVVATLINLLMTPAFSLLPLYITNHFGGGAPQLAVLQAAGGIGMIAGGLLLSTWGGFKRRVVTSAVGLLFMGAGVAGMGMAPSSLFVVALVAHVVAGISQPIVNGSMFAALQASVPPDKQGRVFTLLASGAAAMSPLGLAVVGPIADTIGIPAILTVAGISCTLMGAGLFFIPAVVNLEQDMRAANGKGSKTGPGVEDIVLADPASAR